MAALLILLLIASGSAQAQTSLTTAAASKEIGIQRLGFTGNLGLGQGTKLQFTQSDVSAGGSGITRREMTLSGGGLSLRMNFVRVGENFQRFADLADKDRDALEKLRGGEKLDVSGQWTPGKALKVEGSLLRLAQDRDDSPATGQNNARVALSLTPGGGWSLGAVAETSRRIENARERRESITRFTGATLLGREGHGFGLALRGSYETVARREIADGKSTAATGTTTSVLGLRTAGNSPLQLNLESKNVLSRREGAAGRRTAGLLSDGSLKLGRGARFSCAFASDITTEGPSRTENGKESWGLEIGRGYFYRRSLDCSRMRDGKGERQLRRVEFTQFATDPAGALFASGERRARIEGEGTPEIEQKWKGGLTLGGLSLRADGWGVRCDGARRPEKNNNVTGKLLLPGGWSATYDAFDRADKDPRTGQNRDEAGQALTLTGSLGTLRVALRSLALNDRRDGGAGAGTRRELSLTGARPHRLLFLRQGTFTLACGAESHRGRRGGTTGTLSFNGLLGPHRLVLALGGGRPFGGGASLPGPGFQFTSDERRRLQLDLSCRTRWIAGAAGPESLRTRACGLGWKLGGNHKLTYRLAVNPERPDGAIEKRRSEGFGYTADLGRCGKAAADYGVSEEPGKGARSRSVSFTLASPDGAACGYKLSCARERACAGNRRGETRTYQLALQFQPERGAAQVAIAGRWVDRGGDLPGVGDVCDEAQASVDIKVGW